MSGLAAVSASAFAQVSLADPPSSSPLLASVVWIQDTLLGAVATAVAVIAVAMVGMMMLTGRLDIRRSAVAILGCFILFGAPVVAAGIRSVLGIGDAVVSAVPPERPVATAVPLPPTPPVAYDPYAGAAVPAVR